MVDPLRIAAHRAMNCRLARFMIGSPMILPHRVPFAGAIGVLVSVGVLIGAAGPQPSPTASFPVAIRVDAGRSDGALKPIWRFFGADEPNYAYMKDGQKLLARARASWRREQVYFRTHNLLTSGDGTPALKWGSTNAYREDAQGKPVYDWTIVDRIFDTYLRARRQAVRADRLHAEGPVDQARAVSAHAGRRRRSTTRSTPAGPIRRRTTRSGRELVYQWAKHCVERYGRAEVEQWYWQVWNEPNIGYWRGTPEEFRKLHDYAIDGVRRALPTARVGGPDTAGHGGQFMRDFLEHCLRGTNHATGADRARRSTSSRSTPRAARRSSTATCAWGSPTSSRRSTRASASSRRIPS